MRQIWISKAGPPEVLVVKEAPDPHPAAGEMRIRVEASGVNFADVMGRLGLYPDLPRIPVVPGYEVAGRVDAVGGGVDASWVGRDVFASTRFGGYADVVCAPQAQVFARPSNMFAQEGASIPVNYLTAWQLIVVMGGLKAGETVLIHSAGGGVGIAATQIAKHIGAKVIGTASAGKHEELRALGVDHLIDYRTEDFEQRARQITGGRIKNGSLSPADSQYLAQLVAQRTGLSANDAQKRVNDTFAQIQQSIQEAKAQAQAAADAARKASAALALWLVVSLLLGAFAASWAATFGGRLRDGLDTGARSTNPI